MRSTARFTLAILFTISLVVLTDHGQQIWYHSAQYGWLEAISMELEAVAPVIIPAIIVVILAAWIEIRAQRKQDKEAKALTNEVAELRREQKENTRKIINAIRELKGGGYDKSTEPPK